MLYLCSVYKHRLDSLVARSRTRRGGMTVYKKIYWWEHIHIPSKLELENRESEARERERVLERESPHTHTHTNPSPLLSSLRFLLYPCRSGLSLSLKRVRIAQSLAFLVWPSPICDDLEFWPPMASHEGSGGWSSAATERRQRRQQVRPRRWWKWDAVLSSLEPDVV